MASLFNMVIVLPHNQALASSDATAYYRPAPGRTDGIPIKDHGYKSVFTNSWLVRQRNTSWIKGLGKNPQKSELVHCLQCLLSGATEPWPHGLRETIAYVQVKRHDGMACVACWQGSRQNTQKSELRVYRDNIVSIRADFQSGTESMS